MLRFSDHEISKISLCVCVFILIIQVHHVSKVISILFRHSLLFILKF